MIINKETIFFSLRIILCIVLVAVWGKWLINIPEIKQKKKLEIGSKKQEISLKSKSQNLPEQNLKSKIQNLKPKSQTTTSKSTQLVNELPKLVNLPTATTQKTETKANKAEKKEDKNSKDNDKPISQNLLNSNLLKLPKIANATRQALLTNEPKSATSSNLNPNNEISLRKEVQIEKGKLKPISFNPSLKIQNELSIETTSETWLPKYIAERNGLEKNKEKAISNLDQIANEIELTGLTNNNENQQSAAIIKNKLNNKTITLKKGEEYQGLKLLEINNNEVILGNKDLNKTYIKKIITTNP